MICTSRSATCRSRFLICTSRSAICRSRFLICTSRSAICRSRFLICTSRSATCRSRFLICTSRSATCRSRFLICTSRSATCSTRRVRVVRSLPCRAFREGERTSRLDRGMFAPGAGARARHASIPADGQIPGDGARRPERRDRRLPRANRQRPRDPDGAVAGRRAGPARPPEGLARAYPAASPRVVVLVHGLMCTESIWDFPDDGGDYGAFLGARLRREPRLPPLQQRPLDSRQRRRARAPPRRPGLRVARAGRGSPAPRIQHGGPGGARGVSRCGRGGLPWLSLARAPSTWAPRTSARRTSARVASSPSSRRSARPGRAPRRRNRRPAESRHQGPRRRRPPARGPRAPASDGVLARSPSIPCRCSTASATT